MHNDFDACVKCPFYITYETRKNRYTITCEPMMAADKLGFSYTQQTRFPKRKDLDDYMGIFCMDMYDACPVYKAIMSTRYRGEKR